MCLIQTYSNRQIHAYTLAHAHAPKGLSLTAAPYLARPQTFSTNIYKEAKKKKKGHISEGTGKNVRLKMRTKNTKRPEC